MRRYGWRNSLRINWIVNGEDIMPADKQDNTQKEPLPGRMEALRELPGEILRGLSKAEIRAFLFDEVWPDSLQEKLKDYLA
jgi:hypothetical protein